MVIDNEIQTLLANKNGLALPLPHVKFLVFDVFLTYALSSGADEGMKACLPPATSKSRQ